MPGFRISIDTSSMHRDAERARHDMDELTIAARDTQRGMQGVGNASAAAAQKMGLFSKAAAAAVAALAVKALANAGEYEKALWNMRKVTDESISAIKARIESLPASLGNVTDLAKGYYQVLSAGVTDTAKAMNTLTTASKLAAVAGVEQGEAIKALTKMMAGFKGELTDVATAADTLLDIEQFGQTSVAELVPVIGDISSVAKMAGASYKEMGAALAVVTQTAGSTAQAATQLQALFSVLIQPSEKLGKLIAALGYESGAALVKANGLAGGLHLLEQAAKASGLSLQELLGSTEAIKAQAALASGEYAAFAQTLAGMGADVGRTEKTFESYQHTFEGLWNTIKNSLLDIGNAFAGQLVPASKDGMAELQAALDSLKSVAEGVGAVVAKIASMVVSIVRGIHSLGSSARAVYAEYAAEVQAERDFVKDPTGNAMMDAIVPGGPVYDDGPAASKPSAAKAVPKIDMPKLSANFKAPVFGGGSGRKSRSSGAGRRTRFSGSSGSGGSLGTSQVEFAIQRILELREAVQELNNETSGNALDKKLREIEQAGEKAKLPLKEIASLKEDYTKAFQGAVVRDFNKALLELTGSAQEIRAAKMEETIDEWRKKFVEAKVSAEETAAKLAELRAAMMKKEDLERLEEATDWLSGLKRGMADMAKDASNWGQHVQDLWTGAADSMTDAFTSFCLTGKNSFSDMANSIISDIIRMITKAMIIQPLMNAIGSWISGMFTPGGFPSAGTDAIAPSANGNVFRGGSLAAFAGQVVDRPTLFSYGSRIPAYASGAGLMGEAGPEAIMPLTRMGNGRLGVAAQGGSPVFNINVTNVSGNGTTAEVTDSRRNGSGGFDIDILISQIDSKLAARAAQNKSSLVQYMDKSRGLNSARSLY